MKGRAVSPVGFRRMEGTSRKVGGQDWGTGEQSRVEVQIWQLSAWRHVITLGQEEVQVQPGRRMGA